MTLGFLFLKDLLLPTAPAALWLTYHLSILMNDRKETILKHLQNLGRGHYLQGMSIVLCDKGEVVYGNN